MWRYIHHWQRLTVWETPEDFTPSTKVSVIIPVRNEAENIEACIQSILKTPYPNNFLEVIVVDDHSNDDTLKLLKSINDARLIILQLSDFIKKDQTQSYKKKAIEIAIERSKGDLILTTDGDCIVPDHWVERIVHFYEKNDVKFIAAPVNFYNEKSLLEYFQSIDFTGMMAITGAGIQGSFMNMCNGANLAYDKKAFYAVNGFEGINHIASGDDMLLMQKIAKQFPGKIGYLKNVNATVRTKAQENWNAFYNQRIRWASKSSDYKEWQVTMMLGTVWLFCINIFVSLFALFFLGLAGLSLVFGQLLLKSCVDYALLSRTTKFFRRPDLMNYFLPAQFLHIFYIASVGLLSIFVKKYNWKGRTTK